MLAGTMGPEIKQNGALRVGHVIRVSMDPDD